MNPSAYRKLQTSKGENMKLQLDNYYHIYNMTNNDELLFKEEGNYEYFLNQYHKYLSGYFDMVTYCLMPTHFHFLVKVVSDQNKSLQQAIATFLSAYTKAINKRYNRHGSLFQPRTKARLIEEDILTVITYIHQNPVRAGLVNALEDWHYSGFGEIIDLHKRQIVNRKYISEFFTSNEEFLEYSREMLKTIKEDN